MLPLTPSCPFAWKVLVSLLLLPLSRPSSSPPLSKSDSDVGGSTALYTIHRNIDEAQVAFTVRDRHGNPITGLTEGQINVLQDGRPVPEITSFLRHHDLALRTILVLDTSESMGKGFTAEQRVGQSLVLRMLRPDRDKVSIITFANNSRAISNEQPHLLATSIRKLRAEGQTALYDTLCRILEGIAVERPTRPERRVIVVFSDGEDNWSRHTLDDAIMLAQQADVVVYPITAHSSRLQYVGDRILRRLADATGGQAFILKSYDKLDQVFAALDLELKASYVVGFRPSAPARAPGYHTLRIVPNNRHWIVRSRTGYYVP